MEIRAEEKKDGVRLILKLIGGKELEIAKTTNSDMTRPVVRPTNYSFSRTYGETARDNYDFIEPTTAGSDL